MCTKMCTKKATPAESRQNPALPWRNPFWRGFALSHTGESYERKIPFSPTRQPGRCLLLQRRHYRFPHEPKNEKSRPGNFFQNHAPCIIA
jgi:hypothetical protein